MLKIAGGPILTSAFAHFAFSKVLHLFVGYVEDRHVFELIARKMIRNEVGWYSPIVMLVICIARDHKPFEFVSDIFSVLEGEVEVVPIRDNAQLGVGSNEETCAVDLLL